MERHCAVAVLLCRRAKLIRKTGSCFTNDLGYWPNHPRANVTKLFLISVGLFDERRKY